MDSADRSYCRLCAELTPNETIIYLQSKDTKCSEVNEKLERINAFIDFNDKTLPNTLCFTCAYSLDTAYEFVLKTEQAQTKLRSIFLYQSYKRESIDEGGISANYEGRVNHKPIKEESELFVEHEIASPGSIKIETEDEFEKITDTKEEKTGYVKPDSGFTPEIFIDDKKNSEADFDSEGLVIDNDIEMKIVPKPKQKRTAKNKKVISDSTSELSWNDNIWRCAICAIQYDNFEKLKTHTTEYHKVCNAFRCVDCNVRKFKLDRFLKHVKRHKNHLKVVCFKCNTRFPTALDLSKHMAEHRKGTQTIHTCPGCYTEFKNLSDFTKHTNEYFRASRRKPVHPLVEKITDKLTCLLCNKTFRHKGNLNTHVQIHTKEEKERKHTCDRCGKCFTTKVALDEHIRRHDNIRPYQCKICNNAFITAKQLRMHIGVHDNAKPFACEQCGRCFRLQRSLTAHKIIHTDSLPFACTVCDKRFRFRNLLNQHSRQHTGVKPYSCNICQRDFTNWPNYNKHMKRRHNLDMAKKKHTPNGICPINPATGEVIVFPQTKEVLEWKQEVLKKRVPGEKHCSKSTATSVQTQ